MVGQKPRIGDGRTGKKAKSRPIKSMKRHWFDLRDMAINYGIYWGDMGDVMEWEHMDYKKGNEVLIANIRTSNFYVKVLPVVSENIEKPIGSSKGKMPMLEEDYMIILDDDVDIDSFQLFRKAKGRPKAKTIPDPIENPHDDPILIQIPKPNPKTKNPTKRKKNSEKTKPKSTATQSK
ncbi:hypothetical protein GIB67_002308 [Kingdonia uniflora]|uniref:Uncharacterized protein n=1 Tax=Kingdonia uniflora TaxID=39325 RepID=A0A7J7KX30_9MAGN|nr:hypothetical protein GIB67_002308 [Kingdonia uniflora]